MNFEGDKLMIFLDEKIIEYVKLVVGFNSPVLGPHTHTHEHTAAVIAYNLNSAPYNKKKSNT